MLRGDPDLANPALHVPLRGLYLDASLCLSGGIPYRGKPWERFRETVLGAEALRKTLLEGGWMNVKGEGRRLWGFVKTKRNDRDCSAPATLHKRLDTTEFEGYNKATETWG